MSNSSKLGMGECSVLRMHLYPVWKHSSSLTFSSSNSFRLTFCLIFLPCFYSCRFVFPERRLISRAVISYQNKDSDFIYRTTDITTITVPIPHLEGNLSISWGNFLSDLAKVQDSQRSFQTNHFSLKKRSLTNLPCFCCWFHTI